MRTSPTRFSTARLGVCALMLAVLALVAACSGDKKSATPSGSQEPKAISGEVTPIPTDTATVESSPTPEFPYPKEDAQVERLIIPAAKINAPFSIKGVNAQNEMENPNGKDDVAWYKFTAKPGFGSNAVFSGHVDWYTGEVGVFWYLKDLKPGDDITVKLTDGEELKYKVTRNETYKADDAPVAEIIGPTQKDTITMITCDGTFDKNSQDYSNRRMVRAERVA
jgi:LPXTG-site transpeptidase (sortase) family protein